MQCYIHEWFELNIMAAQPSQLDLETLLAFYRFIALDNQSKGDELHRVYLQYSLKNGA